MQVVANSFAVPYHRRVHLACRSLGSHYKSSWRALLVQFSGPLKYVYVCHGALPNRSPLSPANRPRVTQAPANTDTLTAGLIVPDWSNGRKGPTASALLLPPSLQFAPGERTKRFLNVYIFVWKRETNIHRCLALVYSVDAARGLHKHSYWKTNFPRDFENIANPTL